MLRGSPVRIWSFYKMGPYLGYAIPLAALIISITTFIINNRRGDIAVLRTEIKNLKDDVDRLVFEIGGLNTKLAASEAANAPAS